jgi:hypothetical protein
MVFSTCFEPESSSSGRLLYIQVCYNMFYMYQCKQCCRRKSQFAEINPYTYTTAYTDACKTYYNMSVFTRTTVFLKMNPRVQNI